MSSQRFPGKVLAPFRGEPLIRRIVQALQTLGDSVPLTVLTSRETSDDPLVAYLQSLQIDCFRGPLEDVAGRFVFALQTRPCDWFIRLCADSPFPNIPLMRKMLQRTTSQSADLLTNTFPRSFAKGRSVEIVRTEAFFNIPWESATEADREHVTRYFYQQADAFRIENFPRPPEEPFHEDAAIDTLEDLQRLEAWEIA
jgi:spore coat polysaccharide biosynthesis protein SpsF